MNITHFPLLSKIRHRIFDMLLYFYYLFHELFSDVIYVQYSVASRKLSNMNFNYGDDINKVVIGYLSGKKVVPYKYSIMGRLKKSETYLCIGSIITFYNLNGKTIWGAGIISSKRLLKGMPKQVLAVRGPLTRSVLLKNGCPCPEIYGDPALLLPMIYDPNINKTYKIGVIAHLYDRNNIYIKKMLNEHPEEMLFIDIVNYGNWKSFIDKILSCDLILSSSLHGLIVSDAYHVPNCRCEFGFHADDNGFKFKDYFLSVGRNYTKPYKIDGNCNMDDLLELKHIWNEPKLDISLLLSVCPFYKH